MNAQTPVRADPHAPPANVEVAPMPGETVVDPAPARARRNRRKWFIILGAVVLLAVAAYAIYALFFAGAVQVTDDAYVAGDVVQITSRERATVTTIYADNTQQVRAGQPLIEFDPADADANMAAAEAQLAQAVRGVRSNFSAVDSASAQIVAAQADVLRARNDVGRRVAAAKEGAVSGEELSHAQDTLRSAEAQLVVARSRRAEANAAVGGASLDTNPNVLAAIAAVRRAALVKSHMRLIAPVAGVVAQRSVQIGQQVAQGAPLMAVVPLTGVWIDANFRETQLSDLRVGQPVTIKSDIYGGDVVFHGKVQGINAGSGSAFALLPAQNASGNWIKVTQRLPVRIALDPNELKRYPLQIGLSVKVSVDTANHSGPPVASAAVKADARHGVGTEEDANVDALIARIIAQNSGNQTRGN